MPKYLCTVNAQIHIIKEITDSIEIDAPDAVQAEEDAEDFEVFDFGQAKMDFFKQRAR